MCWSGEFVPLNAEDVFNNLVPRFSPPPVSWEEERTWKRDPAIFSRCPCEGKHRFVSLLLV